MMGREDGLCGSFDRAELLANLLHCCRLCRYGGLCLTYCQVAIDRKLEPSLALSRGPVLFLWLCSAKDKPKVALSVKLLLVLLGGVSGKQV